MNEEIKQLINKVYNLSVYADENKYHHSIGNKLTTIWLQLKKVKTEIKEKEVA